MPVNYRVAILIAVLLSTTTAKPAPLSDMAAQHRLLEHHNRTVQFKCGKPQLRSYKISDLLSSDEVIKPSETIFPLHTVIETCDEGAGCCLTEDMSCRPVRMETEDVIIKVSNVVDNRTVATLRTLKIQHHKACDCRKRSEHPDVLPKITLVAEQ